jgi:hypothetical protein
MDAEALICDYWYSAANNKMVPEASSALLPPAVSSGIRWCKRKLPSCLVLLCVDLYIRHVLVLPITLILGLLSCFVV